MDKFYTTISWVIIAIGAIITFFVKPVIEKRVSDAELVKKYTYIFKIIGMWLVVVGAVAIFIIGGNFGVGN